MSTLQATSWPIDPQTTPDQLATEAVRLWRDLQETENEVALLRQAIQDRVARLPEQKLTEPGLVTIVLTTEVQAGRSYGYAKQAIDEIYARLEEIQDSGGCLTVEDVLHWLRAARAPSPGRARSLRIIPVRGVEG